MNGLYCSSKVNFDVFLLNIFPYLSHLLMFNITELKGILKII